ncbi:hypothetical protein K474DRAFT_803495 [Panus rudis PR-1116 ss-1]|nr:hypothetical protein K474DRAFT_803495 [Panus rudis PR-1116 ss-1]
MLCAMKMHHYLRSSKLTVNRNWKFISDVIRQLIRYTHSAMRSKERGHVAKTAGGKCDVDKAQVVWLGTHAFHTVLSQKAHTYGPILASLEKELNSSHSMRVQLGLKKVAKDCKRLMVILSFTGSPQ